MKTTMFNGRQMKLASTDAYDNVSVVKVPTLSAYAIECAEFTPPRHIDAGFHIFQMGADFVVIDEEVRFSSGFDLKFGGFESCRMTVHYHGIRDYALLFPQVTDLSLRERLGLFYAEAEATFEARAWLSFALMAAAVYEGLLGWSLQDERKRFANLIDDAAAEGLIDTREAAVLITAKENRNLVHAGRRVDGWVTRATAMDMRIVLDQLVRKLSGTRTQPAPEQAPMSG